MSKNYDTWEVYKYDQTDNPKVTSNELSITVYFDRKDKVTTALEKVDNVLKDSKLLWTADMWTVGYTEDE
jgi:hypothetical protein